MPISKTPSSPSNKGQSKAGSKFGAKPGSGASFRIPETSRYGTQLESGLILDFISGKFSETIKLQRKRIMTLLESYDSQETGLITTKEFKECVRILRFPLTVMELNSLIHSLDVESSGNIKYIELMSQKEIPGLKDRVHKKMTIEQLNQARQLESRQREKGQLAYESRDAETRQALLIDFVISKIQDYMHKNLKRCVNVFRLLDLNGDGMLSIEEFQSGIKTIDLPLSNCELQALYELLDANNDNTISYPELFKILRKPRGKQLTEDERLAIEYEIYNRDLQALSRKQQARAPPSAASSTTRRSKPSTASSAYSTSFSAATANSQEEQQDVEQEPELELDLARVDEVSRMNVDVMGLLGELSPHGSPRRQSQMVGRPLWLAALKSPATDERRSKHRMRPDKQLLTQELLSLKRQRGQPHKSKPQVRLEMELLKLILVREGYLKCLKRLMVKLDPTWVVDAAQQYSSEQLTAVSPRLAKELVYLLDELRSVSHSISKLLTSRRHKFTSSEVFTFKNRDYARKMLVDEKFLRGWRSLLVAVLVYCTADAGVASPELLFREPSPEHDSEGTGKCGELQKLLWHATSHFKIQRKFLQPELTVLSPTNHSRDHSNSFGLASALSLTSPGPSMFSLNSASVQSMHSPIRTLASRDELLEKVYLSGSKRARGKRGGEKPLRKQKLKPMLSPLKKSRRSKSDYVSSSDDDEEEEVGEESELEATKRRLASAERKLQQRDKYIDGLAQLQQQQQLHQQQQRQQLDESEEEYYYTDDDDASCSADRIDGQADFDLVHQHQQKEQHQQQFSDYEEEEYSDDASYASNEYERQGLLGSSSNQGYSDDGQGYDDAGIYSSDSGSYYSESEGEGAISNEEVVE